MLVDFLEAYFTSLRCSLKLPERDLAGGWSDSILDSAMELLALGLALLLSLERKLTVVVMAEVANPVEAVSVFNFYDFKLPLLEEE